jgi:hypothetical protein
MRFNEGKMLMQISHADADLASDASSNIKTSRKLMGYQSTEISQDKDVKN